MADDYEHLIEVAAARAPAVVNLPPHMRDDGGGRMRALLGAFGLDVPF
jgi:hypothetical protein